MNRSWSRSFPKKEKDRDQTGPEGTTSAWPWNHTLLDAPSLNLPSRMCTLCQPLSLSHSDNILPPHLSPSCNLTLSDAWATLCACKLSAHCTVSFFLTSLCCKLTTPRTFTLVDLGARATPRHRLLTPHPLRHMNHAPSLPCRRCIVADSTHHQHTRMHAQRHKICRHRLDTRGTHMSQTVTPCMHTHTYVRTVAQDSTHVHTADNDTTRVHTCTLGKNDPERQSRPHG
jgi:hypothetical protein